MVKKAAATEPAKLTAISVTKDAEKGKGKSVARAAKAPATKGSKPTARPKAAPVARKVAVNRQAKPKKAPAPVPAPTPALSEKAEPVAMPAMGTENVEFYVETSRIIAEGFADLSKELAVYAQRGLDSQISMAKAMADAKSVEELVNLQTKAACERLESVIEESAKLTDLSISMTNRAMEPIRSQLDRQVEMLWKPLAA